MSLFKSNYVHGLRSCHANLIINLCYYHLLAFSLADYGRYHVKQMRKLGIIINIGSQGCGQAEAEEYFMVVDSGKAIDATTALAVEEVVVVEDDIVAIQIAPTTLVM